ncbi:MAG: SDR family NAD(P)-dependent oxidoreductase [Chloroflexi bacterium]|nr:SDR family NAD(P)-dependent oxidoreductase [Chloroflexota bacterium]
MFDGKVVFVTGGATGIGAAIVERFATLGADVACCYNKSRADAEALAARLKERGLEIFLVQADVSDSQQDKAAIEATVAHFGRPISILVNNAGDNINPTPVETMDEALWNKVIGINLTGPFMLAKYCIPGMKALGSGRIINVSSISARTGGGPGSAHYVASKAGLEGFTRSLAKELAPFNITVNGIAPGLIYTPIHERINTPESLERLRQTIPLLRIGKADELARVVTFVASEDASFMTGEIVAVNGGMRMD